jgi:hypothetical protein
MAGIGGVILRHAGFGAVILAVLLGLLSGIVFGRLVGRPPRWMQRPGPAGNADETWSRPFVRFSDTAVKLALLFGGFIGVSGAIVAFTTALDGRLALSPILSVVTGGWMFLGAMREQKVRRSNPTA